MKTRLWVPATLLAIGVFLSGCGTETDFYSRLNAAAAEEYQHPIRPASEGRNPCWNAFSKKFTYSPAIDVKALEGATEYRFVIRQEKGEGTWSFTSKDPCSDLSPVWAFVTPSDVRLDIIALDGKGDVMDTVFTRKFLRDFPFEGPYNRNVRPYRESAMMAALYIHNMEAVQKFKDSSVPDLEAYSHFTYPNKIIGSLVSVEAQIARNIPALREEALLIARNAAQFLIDQSRPEGDPLAFFPPTYYGDKAASSRDWNIGKTMTMDACYSGNAFLDLYDVTGDKLYYERALRIADTFAHIQRADGSFPIKVDFATGEPVNSVGAMLHPVLNYANRLEKQYGETRYQEMTAKGAAWMKEVALETFDLTGQFEDVTVEGLKPYENLTNCTAAPYASYILHNAPSAEDIADARDLIRLSEDQFVHWNEVPDENGIRILGTPCVFEQHKYQMPVDNSTCNVANAYLDLYEVTGDRLAFEKARALIDNLTVVQQVTSGQIPTTFKMRTPENDKRRTFWINCSNASIKILLRMAEMTEGS